MRALDALDLTFVAALRLIAFKPAGDAIIRDPMTLACAAADVAHPLHQDAIALLTVAAVYLAGLEVIASDLLHPSCDNAHELLRQYRAVAALAASRSP